MRTLIRTECNLELELVPPHCHRRNVAEVAIKALKQYFLSIISGVATDFPMSQWERLLLQTELTLNMLRQANTSSKVSKYAYMFRPFNYNKMPLGPMGCAVLIHEK